MVWNPLPTKGQGALDHGGGGLVRQNITMGKILNEFFDENGKTSTTDGKKGLKYFHPNWKSWCLMDSKHGKCAPIIKWKQ